MGSQKVTQEILQKKKQYKSIALSGSCIQMFLKSRLSDCAGYLNATNAKKHTPCIFTAPIDKVNYNDQISLVVHLKFWDIIKCNNKLS